MFKTTFWLLLFVLCIFAFRKNFEEEGILGFQNSFDIGFLGASKNLLLILQTFWQHCKSALKN